MGTRKKVKLFTCISYFSRSLSDYVVLEDFVFKSNENTQPKKQQKDVGRVG